MSHIASSHADQRKHVAGQVVSLAGLDLAYGPQRGEDGPVLTLSMKPVDVRAAKMDEYGVGYEFEIRKGKSWHRALLSRRDFGIDKFRVESQAQRWGAIVSARVWFWEEDRAAAEEALREVACQSLERLEESIKESIAAAMRAIRATDASPSARPR